MNTKNKQKKFWVVWGPIFNQSTGDLVVDEQTFSLVPNKIDTALVTLAIGKKAYSIQTFQIDSIIGYENNFMAYMSILLNDGRKVKISVGSRKKKLEIISALEKQRNAIYIVKGESIPELSSTIE